MKQIDVRGVAAKLKLVGVALLAVFAVRSPSLAQTWPHDAFSDADNSEWFCDGIDVDAVMRSVPAHTRVVKYRLVTPTNAYCFDSGGICFRTRTALMDQPLRKPARTHDACLLSFAYVTDIGYEGIAYFEAAVRPDGRVWVRQIAALQ